MAKNQLLINQNMIIKIDAIMCQDLFNFISQTISLYISNKVSPESATEVSAKKNIEIIKNCIYKVQSMTGIYYTINKVAEKYGYEDYTRQVGLIAQQVETFAPEVIKPAPFDIEADGNSISGEHYLTVKYDRLIPVLVEAIKEQQIQIDDLKKQIDNL